MQVIDLTGKTFERLKVIERAEPPSPYYTNRGTWWLRECRCGNKTTVYGNNLRCGITKSCGCLRREMARERALKMRKGV